MNFKERYQSNKNLLEWFDTVALAVAAVAILFTVVVRIVMVDGASMEPTLLNGERLLITPMGTLQYGDIVVIDGYIPHGKPLVKRVIGMAGDEINIDFVSGVVYRNGIALEEPYTAEPTYAYEGMDFPITVPEHQLFIMGDNRNHSLDSRDPEVGCVDTRDVLGRVVWRILPLNKAGAIE